VFTFDSASGGPKDLENAVTLLRVVSLEEKLYSRGVPDAPADVSGSFLGKLVFGAAVSRGIPFVEGL
jgi:hypothetical protein